MRKPDPHFDKRDAIHEYIQISSLSCSSCSAPIEDDETQPYCRNCHSYWQDVVNGLWDDPVYDF